MPTFVFEKDYWLYGLGRMVHAIWRSGGLGCIIPLIFMILLLRGLPTPNPPHLYDGHPPPPSPPTSPPPLPPPPPRRKARGYAGPWLVRGLYISHDQGWARHLETICEIHHIYKDLNESSSARPGRSQQLEITPSLNSFPVPQVFLQTRVFLQTLLFH